MLNIKILKLLQKFGKNNEYYINEGTTVRVRR